MRKNKKIHYLFFGLLLFALFVALMYYAGGVSNKSMTSPANSVTIRFMPIGDSYTIGNGVKVEERWPNLLVESLRNEGIAIELIRNPAISGYDAQDALDQEIPKFERDKPDFGTLFIGANDAFRRRPLEDFRRDYSELLDRMQSALTDKSKLVVITVPNYAQFPAGKEYADESSLIDSYNQIIKDEAGKRQLRVVDLYLVDSMTDDDYFIRDGIHPSPKGIKIWHDAIFPVVREVLR